MGKTSLLLRMLDFAKQQGYRTVSLNLEQVDQTILADLNQFLRWLCANAARQLQLKPQLDEYWDEDFGSKISCTVYIQDYLLESITAPIVLALDELNQIFEHPQVAKDFFPPAVLGTRKPKPYLSGKNSVLSSSIPQKFMSPCNSINPPLTSDSPHS
jgi:hypothetical protein